MAPGDKLGGGSVVPSPSPARWWAAGLHLVSAEGGRDVTARCCVFWLTLCGVGTSRPVGLQVAAPMPCRLSRRKWQACTCGKVSAASRWSPQEEAPLLHPSPGKRDKPEEEEAVRQQSGRNGRGSRSKKGAKEWGWEEGETEKGWVPWQWSCAHRVPPALRLALTTFLSLAPRKQLLKVRGTIRSMKGFFPPSPRFISYVPHLCPFRISILENFSCRPV